jgi:predicted TIM-barrel enzyme
VFAAGVGVGLALSDASAGRALIIVSYWSSEMKPRSARASSSCDLLALSQSNGNS